MSYPHPIEHIFHHLPASLPDHHCGNNIGKSGNIARVVHLPNNPGINASVHHPGKKIGTENGNALRLLRLPTKQTSRGSANDGLSPKLTAIRHHCGNLGKNSGNPPTQSNSSPRRWTMRHEVPIACRAPAAVSTAGNPGKKIGNESGNSSNATHLAARPLPSKGRGWGVRSASAITHACRYTALP